MHILRVRQRHHPHILILIRHLLAIGAAALTACVILTGSAKGSPATAGSCAMDSQQPFALATATGQPLSEAPLSELAAFCGAGTLPLRDSGDHYQLFINATPAGSGLITFDQPGNTKGTFLYLVPIAPWIRDSKGSLECGQNTVTMDLMGSATLGVVPPGQVLSTYSAPLTVQCPSVSVSPATIVRSSQPARITVSGSLFYDGYPYVNTSNAHISYPIDISLAGHSYTINADDLGSFTELVVARGLNCGRYPVEISQSVTAGSRFISSRLSVFYYATTVYVNVSCGQAVTINPDVLSPGELTEVTGTGFVPGTPVTLTWRAPSGGPPLLGDRTVSADGDGRFSTFLLAMPGDLLGPRRLVAIQDGTSIIVNALVQSGSMEPSSGGRLLYRGD